MVDRALFIGRFQPLHLGHAHSIKWILERHEEIIIAIGSSQEAYTLRNPFTAGERMWMVREYLKEIGALERAWITLVPDSGGKPQLWASILESHTPPFSVVYSNNIFVKLLLEQRGHKVLNTPLYNREVLSGRKIRELMAKGGDWEKYVPASTAKVIKEINGVERIRKLWNYFRGEEHEL